MVWRRKGGAQYIVCTWYVKEDSDLSLSLGRMFGAQSGRARYRSFDPLYSKSRFFPLLRYANFVCVEKGKLCGEEGKNLKNIHGDWQIISTECCWALPPWTGTGDEHNRISQHPSAPARFRFVAYKMAIFLPGRQNNKISKGVIPRFLF